MGYLAGDPDPDMDSKKQGLGAKNRVKKGKKEGGEQMCRSRGKVRNLCHEAGTLQSSTPYKGAYRIIVNVCRSTRTLELIKQKPKNSLASALAQREAIPGKK